MKEAKAQAAAAAAKATNVANAAEAPADPQAPPPVVVDGSKGPLDRKRRQEFRVQGGRPHLCRRRLSICKKYVTDRNFLWGGFRDAYLAVQPPGFPRALPGQNFTAIGSGKVYSPRGHP
jgi:hypothetical protein